MVDRGTLQALNKFSTKYDYKLIINEGIGDISLYKYGGRLSLKYDSENKISIIRGKSVAPDKLYKELCKITSGNKSETVGKGTACFVILGGLLSLLGVLGFNCSVLFTLLLFAFALISFGIGFIINN